jgi:hypothetical protein
LLDFPSQWYVGSKSGCGCTFRHVTSTELGFGEPEDWHPEEEDEINATRELCAVLASLLDAGHRVDLVDRWEAAQPDAITTLDVSLDNVSEREFRMVENYKFRLQKGQTQPESGCERT